MKTIMCILVFLASAITSYFSSANLVANDMTSNYQNFNTETKLANNQYYNLPKTGGSFFAWNTVATNSLDSTDDLIVGIVTNQNHSYLLAADGNMLALNFIISDFLPITSDFAMVKITSYQDENNNVQHNVLKFVTLVAEKTLAITDIAFQNEPINQKFALVSAGTSNGSQHDGVVIAAFGFGLEIMTITNHQVIVNPIVPPPASDFSQNNTSVFYPNPITKQGIYIDSTGSFFNIADVTAAHTDIRKIPNISNVFSRFLNNAVVFINQATAIVRTEANDNNNLWIIKIKNNEVVEIIPMFRASFNQQFCIVINQTDVLFLISPNPKNTSNYFGTPMITKVTDLEDGISQLHSVASAFATHEIVAVKDAGAVSTTLIMTDSLNQTGLYQLSNSTKNYQLNLLANYGIIDHVQQLSTNLGIAQYQNQKFLFNFTKAKSVVNAWLIHNEISLKTISYGKINFVNLQNINAQQKIINDYQNMYVSANQINFAITNEKIAKIIITNQQGTKIADLSPDRYYQFSYIFQTNGRFKAQFIDSNNRIFAESQFLIQNFSQLGLKIESHVAENKYVGVADQQLYDLTTIDSNNNFTLKATGNDLIQTIELFSFHTNHLVVADVHPITFDQVVQYYSDKPYTEFAFYGLKITNLLGEVNWVYLGFKVNEVLPIANFWDTSDGKALANEAVNNGYKLEQLYAMDVTQIRTLKAEAANWKLITYSGNAFAILMACCFLIALISAFGFGIFYIYQNKKSSNSLEQSSY